MYARIQEYLGIIHRKREYTSSLNNHVDQFRAAIIHNASKTFSDTKGLHPHLCTTAEDLLRRMKIDTYRLEITTINRDNLNSFLCFCKLSLQVSLSIDPPDKRLQWKAIICNVKHFGIRLQDLIVQYVDCTLGFSGFPLDVTGFVELISRCAPDTKPDESSLKVLLNLLESLNLNLEEFLDQFLPIFRRNSQNKPYRMSHTGDFLSILGHRERYFAEYLSAYAACVDTDALWKIFLYLCQISELNEIIQKHLLLKVNDRISNVSRTKFNEYTDLADKSMQQMKEEKRSRFEKVYIAIFNAFIIRQLTDEQYRYRYYESDCEKLLKILIRYASSMKDATNEPSFLIDYSKYAVLE